MISINQENTGKAATKQANFHFYAKNDPTLDLTLQANPAFLADPLQFVKSLNQADRDTLSGLLWIRHKFGSSMDRKPEIFIGKDSLAAKLGYSSRHIDRVINKLISLGLISKIIGGYNLANVYKFNAIFDHPTYRSKLARFFPALRFLGVAFLCSVNTHFKKDVTANIRVFIYKKEKGEEKRGVVGHWISYREAKKQREERKRMSFESLAPKTKVVTALKLNKLGQLYLTPYHPDAILWANKRIQAVQKPPTDTFTYFKKLCSIWHSEHGEVIEFEYLDSVLRSQPSWRDLPVFEDDGRIHRSTAVTPPPAYKKYEKDGESQPAYQKSPAKVPVSSGDAYQKNIGKTYQDPYTNPEYAKLREYRDPKTFDRQVEFAKFIDTLRAKKAAGETLNPFAQMMLDEADVRLLQSNNQLTDQDVEDALSKLTGKLEESIVRSSITSSQSATQEEDMPWRHGIDYGDDLVAGVDYDYV